MFCFLSSIFSLLFIFLKIAGYFYRFQMITFFSYRHVLLSRQWSFPKSPKFHAFHPCGMIQLSRYNFFRGNLSSDLNFSLKCLTITLIWKHFFVSLELDIAATISGSFFINLFQVDCLLCFDAYSLISTGTG